MAMWRSPARQCRAGGLKPIRRHNSGYVLINVRRSAVKQPDQTLNLQLPAELFNDCIKALGHMVGEESVKSFVRGSVATMTSEQQIEFFCKHVRLMAMFDEIDPDVQVGVVSKRPRAINSIKTPCPQALALHKLARKM